MLKKLIKISTVVFLLTSSAFATEFDLFNRLKKDMWNMGLDFEYIHSTDFKMPKTDSVSMGQSGHRYDQVKSVPYDLILRFESNTKIQ